MPPMLIPPGGLMMSMLTPTATDSLGGLYYLQAKELARQLTLIDFSHFRTIGAHECRGNAWSKRRAAKLAPNIVRMVERFNTLSRWVSSEVLKPTIVERVRVLKLFIRLMGRPVSLQNRRTRAQ